MSLPGEETAVLASAKSALEAAQSSLTRELIKAAINAAGVADPTTMKNAIGTAMSLAEHDLVGAGLSLVSIAPWASDAIGKTATGAQAVQTIALLQQDVEAKTASVRAATTGSGAPRAKILGTLAVTAAEAQRSQSCPLSGNGEACAINQNHRKKCTSAGHPVDVATGMVFTEHVDFSLPGTIPFVFERVWYSSSTHQGPLGHGWHWRYDVALRA
ncbi:MAG: DUF6531 domain-containing protein, partial [Gammaproteobacteria bacterium]